MPQDVPNWPEEDYATFPAARMRIDLGSGFRLYPLARFSLRRQLTTFLPEQVRAASGIAAATGQASLSPTVHDDEDGPQQEEFLSEFTSIEASEPPAPVPLDAPAGLQLGDMVLIFQSDWRTGPPAPPTGGETFQLAGQVDGSNVHSWLWWKIAGAAEPNQYALDIVDEGVASAVYVRGTTGQAPVFAGLPGPDDSSSDPDTWVIDTPSTDVTGSGIEFRMVHTIIDTGGSVMPPDDLTLRNHLNYFGGSWVQAIATRGFIGPAETGVKTWTADMLTHRRQGVTLNVYLADYPAPKRLVPATRPGHWSPFKQNFKPHVGSRFDARSGLVGDFGEALPTVLVGEVTDENGTTQNPELDLRLVDDSVKLQRPYSLPAVIADSGVVEGGDVIFAPGFSPIWVIADILAQGGFPTVPPIRDDAVFAASMLGSAQPELSGNVSQPSFPYGASEFPYEASNRDRTGPAEFAQTAMLPAAASDLYARYAPTVPLRQVALGASNPSLGVTAFIDWEAVGTTAGTSLIDVHTSPGFGFSSGFFAVRFDPATRTVAASSDTKVFASMTVSAVVDSGPIEVYAAYALATPTTVEVTVTICNGDSCTSGTETIPVPPEGFGAAMGEIEIEHSGFALSGVQVLNRPDAPGTSAEPFTPTTALDPSLNDLVATPGIGEANGWSVLNDIASAELGAFWFSETGVPTFQNRASLSGIGKTPTQIITRRRFDELAWQMSTSDVYGEVAVPFTTQGVDASGLAVWSASQQLRVLGNGSRVFEVELDHPTIGVSVTFSANSARNGSGSDLSGQVQINNLEQIDETTVRFIVQNTAGATVWLVDTDGRPDLNVIAHAAIVSGDREEIVSPAAPDNPNLLRVPQNDWMQTSSSAAGVSQFLASQVSEPMATIPVASGRLDTRHALADTVVLVDPELMNLQHRGVIVGYSLNHDAGRGDQDLAVRLLIDTWGDFDQAWNPNVSTNAFVRDEASNDTFGAQASLTINAPDTEEGDRLVAIIAVDAQDSMTPPAGWVEFDHYDGLIQPAGASSRLIRVYVFTKTATGAEPASYTFTPPGAQDMIGAVVSIGDPIAGLEPQVYVTRQPGSWTTNRTRIPAAEPVVPGDPLIWWGSGRVNAVGTLDISWTFDDGRTPLFDPSPLQTNGLAGSDGVIGEFLTWKSREPFTAGYLSVSGDTPSDPSIGLAVYPTSVDNTWEDFNAHWAGKTWDDFDADPLDVP